MDTPLDAEIAKLKERIQRQKKDMEDIRASLAVLMANDLYGDHMVWWYRAYKRDQSADDRRLYEAAENAAKTGKVGLWADKEPVAPWE